MVFKIEFHLVFSGQNSLEILERVKLNCLKENREQRSYFKQLMMLFQIFYNRIKNQSYGAVIIKSFLGNISK